MTTNFVERYCRERWSLLVLGAHFHVHECRCNGPFNRVSEVDLGTRLGRDTTRCMRDFSSCIRLQRLGGDDEKYLCMTRRFMQDPHGDRSPHISFLSAQGWIVLGRFLAAECWWRRDDGSLKQGAQPKSTSPMRTRNVTRNLLVLPLSEGRIPKPRGILTWGQYAMDRYKMGLLSQG